MRKGMNGLALQVQQVSAATRMPAIFTSLEAPEVTCSKIVWHDGIGMSLYAKRLERG